MDLCADSDLQLIDVVSAQGAAGLVRKEDFISWFFFSPLSDHVAL